jgi:hypothetical protein
VLAPEEWGCLAGQRRDLVDLPQRTPRLDRLSLPLQRDRPQVLPLELPRGQPVGRIADCDPARDGRALQPRRRVEDVARRKSFLGGSFVVDADHRLAGLDPDSHLELEVRRLEVPDDVQRRPDGPGRVVLVHTRGAEHADDGITDELLDDASVRLDPTSREAVIGDEQPVDVLGVEPLSQLCRPDDVAEQGRDDLALDRAGRRILHRSILRPPGWATFRADGPGSEGG